MRAQHKILFERTPPPPPPHPPFFKMTWRLRNCPGILDRPTDGQTEDTTRDLTLHSSEQKTGSSELWNLMTSRIVCCLATLGSNNRLSLLSNHQKLSFLKELLQLTARKYKKILYKFSTAY